MILVKMINIRKNYQIQLLQIKIKNSIKQEMIYSILNDPSLKVQIKIINVRIIE